MKIYNTTRGNVVDLSIYDRKSGCEWTADLIGNSEGLNYNRDREMYEMSQEDYEWWSCVIEGLENIDNLTEQARELLDYEDFQELEETLMQEGNANDYEYHVRKLTEILREVIAGK